MVVVMMMVMVVSRSHHLRLRRDRNREAEDSDESEEKPFHALIDADSLSWITRPLSMGLACFKSATQLGLLVSRPTGLESRRRRGWRALLLLRIRFALQSRSLLGLLALVVAHHIRPELNYFRAYDALRGHRQSIAEGIADRAL